MRVALVLAILALAACGGRQAPAISPDGKAVLRDAYDGKLDRNWSCGSLRAADHRLPENPPVYSSVGELIYAAEARACDAALAQLHAGVTRAVIRAALGQPDSTPRCWLYRWRALPDTGDGARICFRGARAVLVQHDLHG